MGRLTVFWDWNGTLCDDVRTALDAVNDMLRRRGKREIDLPSYHACIDTPISRFYEHFFDFSVDPMEKLAEEYRRYYREHLPENCAMPGAEAVLNELRRAGARQVLLSSSHRDSILPALTGTGLKGYFDAVLAAENWLALSKTERAKAYCAREGIAGEDAWFIGDALHDRDTAIACGGRCLLLPIGHQSADRLRQAGEDFCADISEVPSRILSGVGIRK